MRASDQDREAVAEMLRSAAGDGRITLDELDQRLEQTYASRTYADLEVIVADLPKPGQLSPGDVGELRLSAPVNDEKRTGRWQVPPRLYLSSGLGSIKLDFTEAVVRSREIFVEAQAGAGSIVLVVPEGYAVDVTGVRSIMGHAKSKVTAPYDSGSPRMVVTGTAFMGDVIVRHPRRSRFLPK
jgi:Domain of unknown function (DUF1707)/Cell wall-active antibiotics response 4TMS YvqF